MSKAKYYGIPSMGFSNRDADRRRNQRGFFRRKGKADNAASRKERKYVKSVSSSEIDQILPLLQKDNDVYVHGAMKYLCRKCGISWWMFLEKGLEEFGDNHKPVPFVIGCPLCGGDAMDVSGIMKIPDIQKGYAVLPDGESYFHNVPEKDCGVPVFGRIALLKRVFEEAAM